MKNTDILRRIRYIFDVSDPKMITLFELAGVPVSREQLDAWLKKDDDPAAQNCRDTELAAFLNGLIRDMRGGWEGPTPQPEKRLNNNIILRKLKIACDLKDDDLLEIMALAGLPISKPELSAFFRRPEHKNYRLCKDQMLRHFLQGLQRRYRPNPPQQSDFSWT